MGVRGSCNRLSTIPGRQLWRLIASPLSPVATLASVRSQPCCHSIRERELLSAHSKLFCPRLCIVTAGSALKPGCPPLHSLSNCHYPGATPTLYTTVCCHNAIRLLSIQDKGIAAFAVCTVLLQVKYKKGDLPEQSRRRLLEQAQKPIRHWTQRRRRFHVEPALVAEHDFVESPLGVGDADGCSAGRSG